MQTRAAFHLWSRLHGDILGFLDRTPAAALPELGPVFRHIGEVEAHWRRVILGPALAAAADAEPGRDGDSAVALRRHLEDAFAATERLLDGSLVEALVERPIRSEYPVSNALEALTLCHLHTVHHRAEIAERLRTFGVEIEDWV